MPGPDGAAPRSARPHDDDLADALAMVEAARSEDVAGFGAVARNADPAGVLAALVKLLGEALDDLAVPPGGFREWAAGAIRRP